MCRLGLVVRRRQHRRSAAGRGHALSPDGRWLAYASGESNRYDIYVQRFPDGGARSATDSIVVIQNRMDEATGLVSRGK